MSISSRAVVLIGPSLLQKRVISSVEEEQHEKAAVDNRVGPGWATQGL